MDGHQLTLLLHVPASTAVKLAEQAKLLSLRAFSPPGSGASD